MDYIQIIKHTRHLFVLPLLLILMAVSCNDKDDVQTVAVKGDVLEEKFMKKGDTLLPTSENTLAELIAYGEKDYKYSVEDFFRNPEKAYFKISPAGDYFSFLAPYKNRMNIFIQKIGDTSAIRITNSLDRDIAGYFWANNNRILYLKDLRGDENYHLFAVNRDGKDPKDLTPFPDIKVMIIDELLEIEDEMIIGMNKRNKEIFDPYRLNINTGAMELLYENPGNITDWITDHEGRLRMAIVTDGVNHTIMHRATQDEPFKEVRTINFKETLYPLFFTFDNKNAYALSNINRDKTAIVKLDLATGKEIGKPLFTHPDVDVSDLKYSKKRKVLTSVIYITDKKEMKFLDNRISQIYTRLKRDLGDKEVVITSMNKNEDKFLVRTYSDRSLGAYYFYDEGNDSLMKVAEFSPWINEEDLSPMKPITFKTRDGITINGYLTLPQGKDPVNLPVVINPHGGPWHRDVWGYNPEVQLLANRGYAVLQINFRGSTGYGKKFWQSSFKQWGKNMQNDITDGALWLIDQGIADKDRVAIYGGSYGGYATLAGVTFTPELYAAAVDYVGVSNLFTFMETIPPYWKPYLEMMYEMVGNPNDKGDSIRMRESSPIFFTENIKTPLLIVQGANDPRVNIDESDQIVKALRAKGVDVPYLVKYDEGHGFKNEENRIQFYKTMLGFLAKHLKKQELKG